MDVNLRLSQIRRLLAELRRVRVSGRSEQRISRKGNLGAVGRNCGKGRDGPVSGELLLVRAVVIHGPDFFMTAAVGNEINPSSDKTGSAKLLQDVGGELLRHFARPGFVERAQIDFADQLCGAGVGLANVEKKSIEHDLVVLSSGIAESEVVGIRRRPGPI